MGAWPGLDTLAAPKYEKLIRDEWPINWMFGSFARHFGRFEKAATHAYNRGSRMARIQGLWENHRFDPRKHTKPAIEIARAVEAFYKPKGIQAYYSPWCEHEEDSRQVIKNLFSDIRKETSSLILVNNPTWKKGVTLLDEFNEYHGGTNIPRMSGGYGLSWDGTAMTEGDVQKWKDTHIEAATYLKLWVSEFNLNFDLRPGQKPLPIPQRKEYPNARLIRSIYYCWNPRGSVDRLPDLWVLKSHAENHGHDKNGRPDAKANFPVFICTKNVRSIDLVGMDNRKFHTLKQRSNLGPITSHPYSSRNKGYRFYDLDNFGYEIAEMARKHGSPVCYVVIEGKKYKVNFAFRQGSYKN